MSDYSGRLADEIHEKIDYYRKEYNIQYNTVLGVLEAIKFDLLNELKDENDEKEDWENA